MRPRRAIAEGLASSIPPGGVGDEDRIRHALKEGAKARLGGLRLIQQARVVHRDGGLSGDADDDTLGALIEDTRCGVAEEEPAEYVARAGKDWRGKVAAHREMACGHSVIRRILAVARVGGHVVEPHYALATEGRAENIGGARHREIRERLLRHAGEGIEKIRRARVVEDVVEEGPEVRPDDRGRGVRHGLDDFLQVEFGGKNDPDAIERLAHPRILAQFLLRLLARDARRDHLRHGGERRHRLLAQRVAGEHRQHADKPLLDDQWVAGERDHPLARCPVRVADARIGANRVGEVGPTLLRDQADLEHADRHTAVRAVEVGIEPSARPQFEHRSRAIERPDARESGIEVPDDRVGTGLEHIRQRVARVERNAHVGDQGGLTAGHGGTLSLHNRPRTPAGRLRV